MSTKSKIGKGNGQGDGRKQLSIPAYTEEKLAKLQTIDIDLIRERAERSQEERTVSMCKKILEQRRQADLAEKNKNRQFKLGQKTQDRTTKDQSVRPSKRVAIRWHFEDLGVPLRNPSWSWGAISEQNDKVIFRVWRDEIEISDGNRIVRLTFHSKFPRGKELGYIERLKHLASVKNGAKAFAVICDAKDIRTNRRSIKSYDRDSIFPITKILERDGDEWGVIAPGIKVSEYLARI